MSLSSLKRRNCRAPDIKPVSVEQFIDAADDYARSGSNID